MGVQRGDFALRTEVETVDLGFKLGYSSQSLFIGSCFSDNIGNILLRNKFPVMSNPFGVLYNPMSISKAIGRIISHQNIEKGELVFHNNLWHSFDFHGFFSGVDPDTVVFRCNQAIDSAHRFLKTSRVLFITFGTSWVYRHLQQNVIVSNCHKIPDYEFDRFRLSVDEIVNEWQGILFKIQKFNPDLKVVFTVSPVRHLKDGIHANQLSKAVLLLSIDEIIRRSTPGLCSYFPAYEVVNDELRDYRFYDKDMIHLSETGVLYIFEIFKSVFFSSSTIECMKKVSSVVTAAEHKQLTEDISAIRQFATAMLRKIEILKIEYPEVNFDGEIKHFSELGA